MHRRAGDADIGPEPSCFTIPEFCRHHRLGPSTYYKLRGEGRGPREIRLGHKVLISRESAARWRRAMERKSGKR